jgi:hypothetical protein
MSAKQIALAFDQLCNTLAGGWADETFSARCWRCRDRRPFSYLRVVIDGLFFWDDEHCKSSYESELSRNQSPPEERYPAMTLAKN